MRRLPRPPLIPPADGLERDYAAAIVRRCIAPAQAAIRRSVVPRLGGLLEARDAERRADSLVETWEPIQRRLSAISVATMARVTREAPGMADRHVRGVAQYQDRGWMRQVDAVLGIRPALSTDAVNNQIANLIRLNTDLIVTVPERHFGLIQAAVEQALDGGMRIETLTERIDRIYHVSEYNARRIARDQTAKVQALIAQERQRELGITRYIWRTSQDERVRDTHVANNGQRFLWSSPPEETGHPGDDIQCRCTAEPDFAQVAGGLIPAMQAEDFTGAVIETG